MLGSLSDTAANTKSFGFHHIPPCGGTGCGLAGLSPCGPFPQKMTCKGHFAFLMTVVGQNSLMAVIHWTGNVQTFSSGFGTPSTS